MTEMMFTRRAFLQRGLLMASAAATLPLFLQRSGWALTAASEAASTAQTPGVPEDRVLVVIQLGGGNDGLNTVVPWGADEYYRARPGLGIRANQVLKLQEVDGLGLHPNLAAFKGLYDEGRVGILQGVGYPNPNRSHFKSMDIWHTASPDGKQKHGWLGRYFDNTCGGEPGEGATACIAIGSEAPLATQGKVVQPIAFEDARLFQWLGEDLSPAVGKTYEAIHQAGVLPGIANQTAESFLMRTALDAQIASDQVREAAQARAMAEYPGGNRLAQELKLVASMIRAEMPARVYYTSMGGFDTHAGQAGPHANLMRQFSEAVAAFYADLKAQGNSGRVLILTFSEFGRRVRQNASGGTDHGTAAPMFVIGDMVEPGVHGAHPSLSELDRNGDLVFHTDFRSVYSTILDRWLKSPSAAVLGRRFPHMPFLAGTKTG